MRDVAGTIRSFVTRVVGHERAGVVAFVIAALVTFRLSVANRFLPGWDYHYHVMSAAMTSRLWTGDPFYRSLYHTVNPLDSNTLFYTLAFPLEVIGDPLFAARVGMTLVYFIGYPVACAIALRLARRPIWGALLAFPAVHVWSVSYGGFLPFAAAAPFFVLSLSLMDRVLEAPTRRLAIACGVTCALVFLAHAHVYAWMAALLGLLTALRIGRLLVPGVLRDPRAAAREATRIGLRALAVIAPSLLLFARWYYSAHYGHAAAYTPRVSTWSEKFTHLQTLLVFTRSDDDFLYVLALPLVVAACWLLAGRARRGSVSFELAFVLSASAYLYLPLSVSGQAIAARHLDMAMWLLPLVVYPARPDGWFRRGAVALLVTGFAFVRGRFYADELRQLQVEYAGLVAITKDCPPVSPDRRPLVGYATMGMESKVWHTPSPHQAHATLAAMCGMETPLYDTREYPHNVIPLRYRGAPPSPIEILVDDQRWYMRLFRDYDYVLVHAWHPPPAALHEAEALGEPVRVSGEWTLWRRR